MNLLCGSCIPAEPHSGSLYPSDKSLSHRVLLLAMLEAQPTVLENLNLGGAVVPLLEAMRSLGVGVDCRPDGTVVVAGLPARAGGGEPAHLNLGSSSAAARMLIGVLAGTGLEGIVDGDDTLRPRPIDWVVDPLRALGARIDYLGPEGQLPVRVRPSRLSEGHVRLNVGSAQALSAVLYAAYAAGIRVSVHQRVRSRDHTQRLMRHLGATIVEDGEELHFVPGPRVPFTRYAVPVDPSAVVYPIVARLLSGQAEPMHIANVCLNDTRTGMLEQLRRAGAPLAYRNVRETGGEVVGDIELAGTVPLAPLLLDDDRLFHAMIDEVPLAMALATQLEGRSVFRGLGELTFKETNRITATASMLEAFGASVRVDGDSVEVHGRQRLAQAATVPSYRDHRLAMSAAALGLGCGLRTTISGGSCYSTSFPGFVACMRAHGFGLEEA